MLFRSIHELDPHSEYISAADMKRVSEELEGHFSGIGVNFYLLRDTIVVTGIVPGGPSEAAGIMHWDRIVMVNDTLVAGMKLQNEEVMERLRLVLCDSGLNGFIEDDILKAHEELDGWNLSEDEND